MTSLSPRQTRVWRGTIFRKKRCGDKLLRSSPCSTFLIFPINLTAKEKKSAPAEG